MGDCHCHGGGCLANHAMPGPTRGWSVGCVVPALAALTLLTVPLCHGQTGSPVDGSGAERAGVVYSAYVHMVYFDSQFNATMTEIESGRYGYTGRRDSVSGRAVHVRHDDDRNHGCREYAVNIPAEPWIAVMERGHCYFTDKIKLATQNYSAIAVVIYDHEESTSNTLTVMQHSEDEAVAVFVSRATGRRLTQLLDAGVQVMVSITPDDVNPWEFMPHRQPPPTPSATGFMVVSLLVAAVVTTLAVTMYCLLFSARCRRSVSRCQTTRCPGLWNRWMPLENSSKSVDPRRECAPPDAC